jgi:hypothetical protein
MSLLRTVYLGAVICGWMAFAGWLGAEILRQGVVLGDAASAPGQSAASDARFLGSRTLGAALSTEKNQTIAAFCLVGAAIGAGLGLSGGLSNWQLRPQIFRMLRGLIAGGLGGITGGWVGAMIYQTFASGGGAYWWVRPLGWMAAGGLVGLADGLFTFSRNRMRNGVIGGLCGGVIGGILFDPIGAVVARTSGASDPSFHFEITSRAAGFVAVGLCIGGAIGLTHFLLRHAWLTVLDGDRPGRQVILAGSSLTLGSDPGAGLPFLREADRTLLPAHVRIERARDGSFSLLAASPGADADVTIVKNDHRETFSLRNQGGKGIALGNDFVITCGRNSIRFNEKSRRSDVPAPSAAPAPGPAPATPAPPLPKPPPVPQAQPAPVPAPPKQPEAATAPPRASAPAPAAPPKPVVAPTVAPKPAPAPSPQPQPHPQPQPASRGENVCPNGHKVPPGQRYCIMCDTYF